jgi:gas vesicle protein
MANEKQHFLLGILVGGVAGAIAALLYAPQEGQQTREQMKQKAIDAKQRADDAVGTVKETAQKASAKTKATLDEKKAQVRGAVEAGRRAAAEKRAELSGQTAEADAKTSM